MRCTPFIPPLAKGGIEGGGGKTKNDKIDAHKIALLLRGGTLAQAYVYPQGMRETRDLLRRRSFLVRQRALLIAHIQNEASQYNLPVFAKKITYAAAGARRVFWGVTPWCHSRAGRGQRSARSTP